MVTTSSRRRAPSASIDRMRSSSSRRRVVVRDGLRAGSRRRAGARAAPAGDGRPDREVDESGRSSCSIAPGLAADSSIVEPDRLPQRDLVERGLRVGVEHIQAGRDGVGQAGGRVEPAHDAPDAAVAAAAARRRSRRARARVHTAACPGSSPRSRRLRQWRPGRRARLSAAPRVALRESSPRSTRRDLVVAPEAGDVVGTGSPVRTVPTRKFSRSVEELARPASPWSSRAAGGRPARARPGGPCRGP